MAKIMKDLFSNRAIARNTMSAANTLTFKQVQFAVGIFQGVAIVIHKVNYFLEKAITGAIMEATDQMFMGLTVSNQTADISMDNIEVVDLHIISVIPHGTAASAELIYSPLVSDFTGLPSGGMLLPANPIFVALQTDGFVSPAVVDCETIFTFKQLTDKDYIELMQSRIQANI